MRLGKSVVLIILLIFGYVMQCELFQFDLGGIGSDRYLSMDLSYSTNEDYDAIISTIEDLSQLYEVHPYVILSMNESDIEYQINLYGDSFVRNELKAIYGIKDRKYNSLASGSSSLNFYQFSDLISMDEYFARTVYFIGEETNVTSVYEELSESFEVSEPIISGSNEHDMTYTIWVTIDIILILMTVLFAAIKKKEIVIKISMGQDSKMLILKHIIYEIITDLFILIFVKFLCSLFMSGEYMEKECIFIYSIGVLLSALVYFSFAVYNIKKAFSNLFVSKNILIGTYLLKFVVSVGTIFVVITNIELIMQNRMLMGSNEFLKDFNQYYYMDIMDNGMYDLQYDDEWADEFYNLGNKIFVNEYENFKPVISTLALENDDTGAKYVIVNEFGAPSIKDFISEIDIDENVDVVIFVPSKYNTDSFLSEIDYCLSKMIKRTEMLNKKIVVYKEDKTFLYVNRNLNNNMSKVKNPIVVYACFSGSKYMNDLCIEDFKNVMYKMDKDITQIEKDYNMEELGYRIVSTKVSERFEYYNSYLKQGISFCSSVAIFMLLLQIVLIVTVTMMEYKNNALELSLKKILGYSFIKRCQSFMFKTVISGLVVICIGVLVGILTEKYRMADAIITGTIMLIVELGIDVYFILKSERENVVKVLKGGCL